ncbi:ABC transporter substrate-binding protein [Paenibacillus sp. MB22_1]|jgi:branched-chain amino acid transport system substrate-binding protein|uniref:ABC transporter substrate-binding protein n=1 Tax=Paenibacillus TaxID=44249 RepID=UPI0028FD30C7|nr:ABC transporter substrate-binding protein [Paenibacillus sp. 3LSP]MDU0332884.1 ABC transporter substrate-binding protein [Paenibacillus sp. 3LSP]
MKKMIAFLTIIMLVLSACSNGGSNTSSKENNAASANGESNSVRSGGEIKIGALYNVTGGQASLDGPSLAGFQLAAEEINANGGINGKQVKVVSIDAKTETISATNGMQELIDVEKVPVVAGFSDTTYVLAAGPVAQEAGVPFITSGATSPLIPEQVGDFMYMAAFGDDAQSYAISDFSMDELGAKTAWVLTDTSSDFTVNVSAFFKDRFTSKGGEILLEDKYDGAADTDFSAQITRLKSLPELPDVLMVSALPDKAGIVVKQIRDMGIETPILSADGFDTPALIEMGGTPQTNNVFFATHVALENSDEKVQNFVKAYTDKTGNAPENAFAALGYDTMYLIADAITRAGSEDPKAIRDALNATSGFKTVTGEISYGSGRVPDKSVTIIEVKDGKFEFRKNITPEK